MKPTEKEAGQSAVMCGCGSSSSSITTTSVSPQPGLLATSLACIINPKPVNHSFPIGGFLASVFPFLFLLLKVLNAPGTTIATNAAACFFSPIWLEQICLSSTQPAGLPVKCSGGRQACTLTVHGGLRLPESNPALAFPPVAGLCVGAVVDRTGPL